MAVFRFGKYDNTNGANTSMYFSMLMGYTQSQATLTSTMLKGEPSAGDYAQVLGSNFTYTNVSGPLRLASGTITSIQLFENDRSTMSITDITLNAKDFGRQYFRSASDLGSFVTRGNDSMFGTTLQDFLSAGAGNDTVFGGNGNDYLYGGLGTDRVEGGDGDDTLYGNGETLGTDANFVFGGNGNDFLQGSDGDDRLEGGAQNDNMFCAIGNDQAFGGSGRDLLIGDDGNDRLDGGSGIDTIVGGNGSDRLFGQGGEDTVQGSDGKDSVYGGAGNDVVTGDTGNDLLSGGTGHDVMSGGTEADRFVFDTALGASNVDEITDFEIDLDKIVLDNDIFKALGSAGNLAAGQFRTGLDAADANDRIIYDAATGQLCYDRDGNGAAAKVLFAVLASGLALDAGDFTIIG